MKCYSVAFHSSPNLWQRGIPARNDLKCPDSMPYVTATGEGTSQNHKAPTTPACSKLVPVPVPSQHWLHREECRGCRGRFNIKTVLGLTGVFCLYKWQLPNWLDRIPIMKYGNHLPYQHKCVFRSVHRYAAGLNIKFYRL